MEQPEPRVVRLLQLTCTVDEYREATKPNRRDDFIPWPEETRYWTIIPNYLVSRCPVCQLEYYAKIDTFNLQYHPLRDELGNHITRGTIGVHETNHCKHYIVRQPFVDLHGVPSVTINNWAYDAMAPGIQRYLMPDDQESYAVIHALPICRIENEQFVPRYTLYLMIYFAPNPRSILQPWYDRVNDIRASDSEYYEAFLKRPPEDTNLRPWVERGRLKWLDLDHADLPLVSGPVEAFPYADIRVPPKPVKPRIILPRKK